MQSVLPLRLEIGRNGTFAVVFVPSLSRCRSMQPVLRGGEGPRARSCSRKTSTSCANSS